MPGITKIPTLRGVLSSLLVSALLLLIPYDGEAQRRGRDYGDFRGPPSEDSGFFESGTRKLITFVFFGCLIAYFVWDSTVGNKIREKKYDELSEDDDKNRSPEYWSNEYQRRLMDLRKKELEGRRKNEEKESNSEDMPW